MIIRRTRPNVCYLGETMLIPGLNAISEQEEKKITGDKHLRAVFQELISNGSLVIVDKQAEPKEYPYEKKSVAEMLKLIPEILDVKMLKLIQERSESVKIQRAVEKQLKEIDGQRKTVES